MKVLYILSNDGVSFGAAVRIT